MKLDSETAVHRPNRKERRALASIAKKGARGKLCQRLGISRSGLRRLVSKGHVLGEWPGSLFHLT